MSRQIARSPNRVARSPLPQVVGIAAAGLGIALFIYAVRRAGVTEVAAGVGRIGWGFALVLALSAFRLFVRALAWIQCLEVGVGGLGSGVGEQGEGLGDEGRGSGERERRSSDRTGLEERLKPAAAFRAILAGEALGNLTPLGLMISEPAKATFVRKVVPITSGLPALAIETIFYSVSAAIVIGCGMALLLGLFNIPDAIRAGGYAALVFVAIVLGVTALVMSRRWRPASAALRVVLPASLEAWIVRVGEVEERIYGFARRHPGRLPAIASLEFLFHVAGVAEAYLVLLWLGVPVTVVTAFVLEAVNRIVNVLFRFVPLRLGVDEAGSGLLTHVLGFGAPTGVALAIIRKARVLVWSAVGLGLLAERAARGTKL